ncbi:MAG: hypothetical protein ABFS28_06805 [Bacteroidota bacterium]
MLQDVISTLGIANPQLSLTWLNGTGTLTEASDFPLQLVNNGDVWIAPATGFFNRAFARRLSMEKGETPSSDTWVLSLTPQVKLRLARLYGRVLEGRTTQSDRVQRPVPAYFAFHGTTDGGALEGVAFAGDLLKLEGGRISIHDDNGQLIDGLATVSAFVALMNSFPALVAKDFVDPLPSTPPPFPNIAGSQLGQLAAGIPAPPSGEVWVRIITLFRNPFTEGENLENLIAIDAPSGLYRMENPEQAILREVTAPDSRKEQHIGASSFGVLDTTFTPRALDPAVPLSTILRDFLTLYVDDLDLHLLGNETLPDPFDTDDFKVHSFHNEALTLLANGNQVTAQAGQIISVSDQLSLVVSPVVNSDFAVADAPDVSEWPLFPAGNDGNIAGRLREVLVNAHFLASPDDPRDVFLSIEVPEIEPGSPQLAPGTAIRIFNRKFLADAREGRGNGAGSVLNSNRISGFRLENPFGLRPSETIPVNPILSFDLIAVNRSGSKRSFGLLNAQVVSGRPMDQAEISLASQGANPYVTASERSVAPAGLLGLPAPPLNTLQSITDVQSAVDLALSLSNETQPRVAPRLPIMTRNETLVAGRDLAGNWTAMLGGLWLRKDSRSSFHRLGSPGSPGGEEFLGMGLHTSGGLLAYEMARMALRRTRNLADRLTELGTNSNWIPPVSASGGTFSIALLQNIAPGADSPALKLIPDVAFDLLPESWPELVNDVASLLPPSVSSLTQVRNAINNLANNAQGILLYNEFRREVFTSRHGRQDALPVLTSAIKSARDLIYIETSALSYTDYEADGDRDLDPPNRDTDLISLIAEQMTNRPNLKVLIAVSKEVLSGQGYESFAARAYDRRKKALDILQGVDPRRVTLFHPIGFPGRPLRIMHNLVIVDDIWMFAGSGSFNRRGLLFDGNLSLVCFDRQIERGRSRSIRDFRRKLLENYLGVTPNPGSPPEAFPHPNKVRLGDLNETFFAVRDMLEQGGSGLIEGLFDGVVTGEDPVQPSGFPHRDLADPDGTSFPTLLGTLLQTFIGLGDAQA